ncbi:MAG: hypothetical protein WCK09_05455, partial [Bacteroidota bacterium]
HFDSNSPADNIAPTARNAPVSHRATRNSLLWSAVKKILTIVIKSTLWIRIFRSRKTIIGQVGFSGQ